MHSAKLRTVVADLASQAQRRCARNALLQVRPMSSIPLPADAKKRGNLLVWGRVDDNRLGMRLPSSLFGASAAIRGASITAPILNPNLANVRQVVCKAAKTLALTEDGSVYSWGHCENMSLGHGESVLKVGLPKKIEALNGIKIVQVDAAETSSAAVSEEGEVFTWGWGGSFFGGNGGLGHGDDVTQPQPALVEGLAGVAVQHVAVGATHMLALTKDGKVYTWGNGEYGRCGNGRGKQLVPEQVELLADMKVVQVAAGANHSLALTETGKVYAWGKNEASQLGLGGTMIMDLNTMEAYPTLIELEGDDGPRFNNRVVRVAAGHAHSLAITNDGAVWQWGGRTFIQPTLFPVGYTRVVAGNVEDSKDAAADSKSSSSANSASTPAVGKEDTVNLRGVEVCGGDGVSGVIDASGQVFTWGRMTHSAMLGLGASVSRFGIRQPTRIDALTSAGVTVSSLSFGTQHAAAIVGIPRSL